MLERLGSKEEKAVIICMNELEIEDQNDKGTVWTKVSFRGGDVTNRTPSLRGFQSDLTELLRIVAKQDIRHLMFECSRLTDFDVPALKVLRDFCHSFSCARGRTLRVCGLRSDVEIAFKREPWKRYFTRCSVAQAIERFQRSSV